MPHFRVDDALHSHPKARQAGLEAMGLWNMAGSYCMGYLTDGFVPEWYVKTWPKGTALAKRLVAARMWHPAVNDDGEKGWQFHEFIGPGRNDSRAQILADRQKWRSKKAGQREESPPVSPQVSPGDTTRESPPESPGDSLHVTRDPTQPNPTQQQTPGSETNETPVSRPPKTANTAGSGTRLPADWEPNQHVIAQMRSDHPHVDLRFEHAKFVDHWQAKPGKDGRKADWNATWRNWIRRAAEQSKPTLRAVNGHRVAASDAAFAQAQALKTTPANVRLELE